MKMVYVRGTIRWESTDKSSAQTSSDTSTNGRMMTRSSIRSRLAVGNDVSQRYV
jgi:hypothetical protein